MNGRYPALLFLAGLGLTLGGCGEKQRRSRDTGEVPECAEGFLADPGQCVPESCGTGIWGSLDVDEGTVYVDIEAAEGGDGTEGAPFRSIQVGLDSAGSRGGGLVAVAAGTYPETLELGTDHAGVHLAGRCQGLVTLDASVGDESTPGIDIDTRYGEVEVSGMSTVGSAGIGVLVGSGIVRLTRLGVKGSAFVGIGACRVSSAAPTDLVVEGCEVAGNISRGLLIHDTGTQVTLVDSVVRDSQPEDNGDDGVGIDVHSGATLMAEGCTVTRNAALGIAAGNPGTQVMLTDTVVHDTLPDGNGEYGYGIQATEGAWLTLERCRIARNTGSGITAAGVGTELTLDDTVVQKTEFDDDGAFGLGIEVQGGAALTAEGSEVAENASAGILATGRGSEARLVDTVVRDTYPDGNGELGAGIEVQGGAVLSAKDCEVVRATTAGIRVLGANTEVTVTDTTVRDILPVSAGVGVVGILVFESATLEAVGCEIAGNPGLGIAAAEAGTGIALIDTFVQNNYPDANGAGGHGIVVTGGATLSAEGCEITQNTALGILATKPDTRVSLHDSIISGTGAGMGPACMTAVGLAAQLGASVTATALLVRDNDGPGLYTVSDDSELSCTGCTLLDNAFAAAVVLDEGVLEIRSSAISGTRVGPSLGGGVGIYAAQQGGLGPPTLLVSDSTLSNNVVAGAWLKGAGHYQLERVEATGGLGVPHGATIRCGDGVFAAGTTAWDDSAGLSIEGSMLSSNQGAGLFLDDASAQISGNDWSGNDTDLLVQGEACLSPREDYAEAPTSEICPTWDRPSCELRFSLNLTTAELDPALPPPPTLARHAPLAAVDVRRAVLAPSTP